MIFITGVVFFFLWFRGARKTVKWKESSIFILLRTPFCATIAAGLVEVAEVIDNEGALLDSMTDPPPLLLFSEGHHLMGNHGASIRYSLTLLRRGWKAQ